MSNNLSVKNILNKLSFREAVSDIEFSEINKKYFSLSVSDKEYFANEVIVFLKDPNNLWAFDLHRTDYVLWLSGWIWNFPNMYDMDVLGEVMIPQTVFLATVMNIPVLEKIVSYIWYDKDEPAIAKGNYSTLRGALFASQEVVGIKNGKNYCMVDLVDDLKRINKTSDSLVVAEFKTSLQKMIEVSLSGELKRCFFAESAEVVAENLVDFINFFIGVEVDKVLYVCSGLLHPEAYVDLAETLYSDSEGDGVGVFDVKSKIDSQFPKNPTGEYEDIDGVMAGLDRLATETGDDSIRDLYYFNESTGKFEWKE